MKLTPYLRHPVAAKKKFVVEELSESISSSLTTYLRALLLKCVASSWRATLL